MQATFQKPVKSIPDQITLLQSRGLLIPDTELAKVTHLLKMVGYYRFSGYFHFFYEKGDRTTQTSEASHCFITGTSFEDIFFLYKKDEALRLILIKLLHRLEVALKSLIRHTMESETQQPYWYMHSGSYFNPHKKEDDGLWHLEPIFID